MAFKRSVSETLTTVVEYRLDDHDLIELLRQSGARAARRARRGQEYATFRPIAGEGAACARLERAGLLMSQGGQYCITSDGLELAGELVAKIADGKNDEISMDEQILGALDNRALNYGALVSAIGIHFKDAKKIRRFDQALNRLQARDLIWFDKNSESWHKRAIT